MGRGVRIKISLYLLLLLGVVIGPLQGVEAATVAVRPNEIYIVGPTVAGDYEKFVYQLKHSKVDIEFVIVAGPGGSVQEAIKIGHLIRHLNLQTYAPPTENYAASARQMVCRNISKIDSSAQCMCASACFLIWAAGEKRFGNDLLIHSIAYDKTYYGSLSPNEASKQFKRGLLEVHDYLQEMDIPDAIYEEMLRMPSAFTMLLPQRDYETVEIVPAYREWINAKCSRFPMNSAEFSICYVKQMHDSAIDGVRKFRLENE